MIEQLKIALEQRLKHAPPLGYNVLLDFGDEGHLSLHADNTVTKDVIMGPDTTLSLSLETMQKIVNGETDPNMAVLMGKMKVGGKMGVALKLASYLED